MLKSKGKILKYKSGYNPNSSSVGTNLTPLLIGAAVISLCIPIISIFVARRIKKKNQDSLDNDIANENSSDDIEDNDSGEEQ